MSIGNAKTFITSAMNDKELRGDVNAAVGSEAVQQVLEDRGIPFDYHEFDEAYHNMLTECRHEELAAQLKEFKMWWDLTMSMMRK